MTYYRARGTMKNQKRILSKGRVGILGVQKIVLE